LRDRGHSRTAYAEPGDRPAQARPPFATSVGELRQGAPLLLDTWRTALLVGWDALASLCALWLARAFFVWEVSPVTAAAVRWPAWLALPLLTVTTQYYFDAYRVEVLRSRSRACFQSLKASVVSGVCLLLGLALLSPGTMPRDEVVGTLGILAISTLGIRLLLRDAIGFPIRRVLLSGSGPAVDGLAAVLRPEAGYVFGGYLEEWARQRDEGAGGPAAAAPAKDPLVIVTETGTLPREVMRQNSLRGARVFPLDRFYESLTGRVAAHYVTPPAESALRALRLEPGLVGAKRVADTLIAAALFVAAAPLMTGIAVLVKLTSSGPCFYSQVRVGLNGRMFRLWKFRSMHCQAERGTGPVWAARNDPRVTPLGRVLRRSRLDELPQLWNVLRGDMSLIGPRPERPVFVARFRETIPFYEKRLTVRPGLSGWAQVWHRYDESEADVAVKLQFDLFYIKHWSPLLDLQIAIKTIATVLTGSGAR
jgi:exopolysaccharide biosynthesis polyprenyl glycosylphosphotransferase